MFSNTFTLTLAALLIVSGCDSTNSEPLPSEPGLYASMPNKIRESLAIDYSQVEGVVNVNGQNYPMSLVGSQYRAVIDDIPANSDLQVDLLFSERQPDDRLLRLARTERINIAISNTDVTRVIQQQDYSYDFDFDNDGITNIVERNNGWDPFVDEPVVTRNVAVNISIPQVVNEPGITQIIAFIGGSVAQPNRVGNGNLFTARKSVPTRVPFDIDIRLQQQYQGQAIIIGGAIVEIPAGDDDITYVMRDDLYDFSFDYDGDGISNLNEIQSGTDPFLAN